MCKLLWNIVPNVYNSLQSSFLSLPKGNQWEWWDPQQGPLPGLGEVGHSPRGTRGSAGTLDWGPMWFGSQSTYHPQYTLTPPNSHLHTRRPPMPPYATYTPSGLWVPILPASPQYTPDTPTPPDGPNNPYTLWRPPMPTLSYLYPFWLSTIITLQLTIFTQLECSFSIVVIFNCCHFATTHLPEYVQFTRYHL